MKLENRRQTWKKHVMQSVFATSGFLRRFTAHILLTVFICLGLVPAGFMPGFSRDGQTGIILCSGFEQKTIVLDDDGHPVNNGPDIPCVFSINSSPVPVIAAVVVTAPVFTAVEFQTHNDTDHQNPVVASYASRAPPIA